RRRGRDRAPGLEAARGARIRFVARRRPCVARGGRRPPVSVGPPEQGATSHLERELREQPLALERLIATQRQSAERIAGLLRRDDVDYVLIASRGSSSNAARYAQYVLGRAHRVPVAFATPSLYTLYGQPP